MQCKDVMVKLIEMKKINQCQLTQVAVLLAWIRQDSSTQSQSKRTTWVSQIYRAVHDRSSYLFSNQSEDRQRAEPINLIFVWKFSERVVVRILFITMAWGHRFYSRSVYPAMKEWSITQGTGLRSDSCNNDADHHVPNILLQSTCRQTFNKKIQATW